MFPMIKIKNKLVGSEKINFDNGFNSKNMYLYIPLSIIIDDRTIYMNSDGIMILIHLDTAELMFSVSCFVYIREYKYIPTVTTHKNRF